VNAALAIFWLAIFTALCTGKHTTHATQKLKISITPFFDPRRSDQTTRIIVTSFSSRKSFLLKALE